MKRIMILLVFVFLASGIIFLFVFANIRQNEVICKRFEIEIDYNKAQPLINKSTIKRQITKAEIRIKGQPVSTIKIKSLQKLLNKNPYIKKATVSIGVDGIITAHILQRDPLVRVIDYNYNECLIDHDGYMMPVNADFPVRLVLANGNIKKINTNNINRFDKHNRPMLQSELSKIYKTALALEDDSLTSALVEQIYLNQDNELELIPKIGDQSILIGDTTGLDDKLERLKIFYTKGMRNDAWNTYKVINLKYQNQVVCSK
ncbi:MAG: hypothetical protein WCQ70_02640 [Lentimicrobiaceae bacterium]